VDVPLINNHRYGELTTIDFSTCQQTEADFIHT